MNEIRILDSSFNAGEFNAHATHPLQSWQWGEARRKTGTDVVRLGEYENGTLKNVFQMTLHPLRPLPFRIGYLPRSVYPSVHTLDFLTGYARKNRLLFIKIEPYTKQDEAPELDPRLVVSPHALFPPWTQMLDLTPDEDSLLKNMKQKTRYNIRLAQKKGVVVKEMSDDRGFAVFSRLYFDTCRRQKYYGHTEEYHRIIWNALKDGTAHILIAYYGETPLAAYELFHFNGVFYYPYGGTSLEYRNLMPANLLMWEAVRMGKRLGAKRFDMWGSLPPGYDHNHPWAGFTRFKEGYGTEFVRLADGLDLVPDRTPYMLYNAAYAARGWYLALRKSVAL